MDHASASTVHAAATTSNGAGGIRACWIAGGQAVLLREHADQALLLVADERAEDVWQELLAAGRPLELSFVGIEALARLDAARRQ